MASFPTSGGNGPRGPVSSLGGGLGRGELLDLHVSGIAETKDLLKQWGAVIVYTTAITSRKVANLVLNESNRHVPYDKGELFDSQFIRTDGPGGRLSSMFGWPEHGTELAASVENFVDPSDTISGALMGMEVRTAFNTLGHFGARMVTYTRYTVGYGADHAAIVHERDIPYKSGKGPYPGERKTSHYLLNAYRKYQDRFSSVMAEGIRQSMADFQTRLRPKPTQTALGGPIGRPRLVRPGGR